MSLKFCSGAVGLSVALAAALLVPPGESPASGGDYVEPPRGLKIAFEDVGFQMEFMPIRATGEKGFFMGATAAETNSVLKQVTGKGEPRWPREEGPRHKVILTKSFALGKFEVTQKQYRAITNSNPSHFRRTGKGQSV